MSDPRPQAFVVEDETLVLFNLEDMLAELGYDVAGVAMRLDEAQRLAQDLERFDVAILDVNLGGALVFPAAQVLVERGIPFMFATGYGREGLPPEWVHHEVVQKPYSRDDIERALARLRAGMRHATGPLPRR